MRVCIVAFSNLTVCPYVRVYADLLESLKIKYDIIYWDRRNKCEPTDYPTIRYGKQLNDEKPLIEKLPYMYGYARFIKRTISEQKYNRIIVLTSLPGVLLSGYLAKYYQNRYIFDIRDYSYEHISFYNTKMKSLMTNSALNVISSPGFLDFLPSKNAVICHNMSFKANSGHKLSRNQDIGCIRIGFAGVIRYYDECIEFIDAIKNDSRIEFRFYGEGPKEHGIREYCRSNMVTNVKFFGPYKPDEKEDIIDSIDIIYNAYGNKSPKVRYALSNKCYDAPWYKKPLLVNENTSMADYTRGYSYAISDNEKHLADNIYNWYMNIDWRTFDAITDKAIQKAMSDNEVFKKKLIDTLCNSTVP